MLSFGVINNLPSWEMIKFKQLIDTFNYHNQNNLVKQKYYEGAVSLNDVNLGIALPKAIGNLKIGCDWGAKTVDVLASRSMFDGFVNEIETEAKKIFK